MKTQPNLIRSIVSASALSMGMGIAGLLAFSGVAQALVIHAPQAPVVWTFNLPAASSFSSIPGYYPTVATLTLTQVDGNVQFLLDPNQLSSGVKGDPSHSFVNEIEYVYQGRALTSSDFALNSGAIVKFGSGFTYEIGKNMDAGYKAENQYIQVAFVTNAPKKNQPDQRFSFNTTSTWTVANVSLADFTDTFATPNSNKPTPIYGVISVSPYSLDGLKPNPSNWVAGALVGVKPPQGVPEPGVLLLVGVGLVGLGLARRRKPR